MHTQTQTRSRFAPIAIAVLIAAAGVLFAGPLTPPSGPVTSTSKTLTEVEPRIAINATNTPGDNDATPTIFKITQPGSYYLTENMNVPLATRGIEILASNVTIDLNGFTITGQNGSVLGIASVGNLTNVTVRNGTVEFFNGVGINLVTVIGGLIENVTVNNCGSDGFRTSNNFHYRNCIARNNTGSGFSAANSTTFESCTASSNGGIGLVASVSCVVRGCVATGNTNVGLSGLTRSVVTECVATQNAVGFNIGSFSTVTSNNSTLNVGAGFSVGSNCALTSNNASENGTGAAASAGFLITGNNTRVEGNNSISNDTGFEVLSVSNILLRNTASGNTTGWIIAAGNTLGPIVNAGVNAAAISGNAAASTLGSTEPNANFTY